MKDLNQQVRYLSPFIYDLALRRQKMAFISGPRQAGKTTLAKMLAQEFDQKSYQNWDEANFRKIWSKNPNQITESFDLNLVKQTKLLILDEIHKSKGWKQKVKGLYDHLGNALSIIVTGSARLNVYNKGGDSLMGRYFHFRLHPFSVSELMGNQPSTPDDFFKKAFSPQVKDLKAQDHVERLTKLGGFPEPLLEGDEKILNLWRQGRLEKVVRQDLRDLTHIQEVGHVEALMSLLPERVGAPLSTASLREDLEISFDTVKRWMKYLEELYYIFSIRPYTKSIVRTLKKEPKIYLFDWTEIENPGFRFENMVASHLLKACQFWEDTGEGQFQLSYLRDKEKNEVDFVVVRNKKPWFTVECKLSDTSLSTEYQRFQKQLRVPHLQLVHREGVWRKVDDLTWIASAEYILPLLI